MSINNIGLPDFFWADKLTPINYYGYRSVVCDKFFEVILSRNEKLRHVFDRFNALKIKCMGMSVDLKGEWTKDMWDNKVVIECETERGHRIFVGFYDSTYSIGMGRTGDNWVVPLRYKEIEYPHNVTN